MPSTTQILFYVFDILFDFWPVLVLAPLQNRKNSIRSLLYGWIFWAIIRIALLFNPEPSSGSMLIREPLSTTLFFTTGLVLATLTILKGVVKSGSLRRKANSFSVKDLDDLPPGEFEEMTAELFRALGYEAHRTKMIGDHGVDVVVKAKDGRKMVVQCKRWRGPVGEPMVRDFYGAMQHEKAAKGTIFATNGFTDKAIEWAKGKPLLLYDGKKFLELWKKAEKKGITGQ